MREDKSWKHAAGAYEMCAPQQRHRLKTFRRLESRELSIMFQKHKEERFKTDWPNSKRLRRSEGREKDRK